MLSLFCDGHKGPRLQFRTERIGHLALERGVVAKPREPSDSGFATEPSHLSLGVLPRRGLSLPDRFLEADLSTERGASLPVPEGLKRLQPRRVRTLKRRARLL